MHALKPSRQLIFNRKFQDASNKIIESMDGFNLFEEFKIEQVRNATARQIFIGIYLRQFQSIINFIYATRNSDL